MTKNKSQDMEQELVSIEEEIDTNEQVESPKKVESEILMREAVIQNGIEVVLSPLFDESELEVITDEELLRLIKNEASKRFRYGHMDRSEQFQRAKERDAQLKAERDRRKGRVVGEPRGITEKLAIEEIDDLDHEEVLRHLRNTQSKKSIAKSMDKFERVEELEAFEVLLKAQRDKIKPKRSTVKTAKKQQIVERLDELKKLYDEEPTDIVAGKIETFEWVLENM